ncbi:MAG: Holliday junction resolvase RuvX [Kiritimatiellia bacterium]
MRILAVDYGTKRMGFALSDPDGLVATPLCVRKAADIDRQVRVICEILEETEAEALVLGLPLNMNGTESEMSRRVRRLKLKLEEVCRVPIVLRDERLSSGEAERALLAADVSRAKRKHLIDKLAARVLLQSYLETQSEIDAGSQAVRHRNGDEQVQD